MPASRLSALLNLALHPCRARIGFRALRYPCFARSTRRVANNRQPDMACEGVECDSPFSGCASNGRESGLPLKADLARGSVRNGTFSLNRVQDSPGQLGRQKYFLKCIPNSRGRLVRMLSWPKYRSKVSVSRNTSARSSQTLSMYSCASQVSREKPMRISPMW